MEVSARPADSSRTAVLMEDGQRKLSVARENPVRGEERIASELLVKLRIQVSPRILRKYMPKRLDG
jgi:hypothetical protein